MTDLYQSGWSPRGARKAWDRCSMDVPSTVRAIGNWHDLAAGQSGKMLEAVGWFDDGGDTKIIAADYDNGKRLVMFRNARGWRITFERLQGQRASTPAAQSVDDEPGMPTS